MDSAQGLTEMVIDIDNPKQPVSFFSLLVVLFIILAFLGLSAFGMGFFIGRNTLASQPVVEKQTPSTVDKGENTIYTDSSNKYSITYPKIWTAKTRESGVAGVLISSQTASVELWLGVQQDVGFSSEQAVAIEKTTKVDLSVNGTKQQMTEYLYKAGNYFATLELPATNKNPLVSFWIKAEGSEDYLVAKGIVTSFTFL